MSFFTDHRGHHYPTSRIRSISGARMPVEVGRHNSRISCFRVTLDDDQVFVTYAGLQSVLRGAAHMIAAAPGTFLLGEVSVEDGSPADVSRVLVIGYAINADGEVTPYTVDGPDDGVDQPSAILTPDGRVTEQALQSWESVDAWFAEKRAEKDRGEPEPRKPQDGDDAEVFNRHARWVAAQEEEGVQ